MNTAVNSIETTNSDLVLPPFTIERAIAVLEWLRQGLPQEQKTFDSLTRTLNETSESVSASNGDAKPTQHFVLPPFDPKQAIATLESFYDDDIEEQRETFEYLKKSLNEERAANGERLVFADE